MKITKFVHACVLVEDNGKAVLFDPGMFSWMSGLVKVKDLPELEAVVITHQHSDHLDDHFVKALLERNPDQLFVAPPDTQEQLRSYGATKVSSVSTDSLKVLVGSHAPVEPFGQQVQNLTVHWNNLVTHPGDSHDFKDPKPILFLPVQAPWGTTVRAMQLIQEHKPKFVLPIHDWMWNDQWREVVYNRTEQICQNTGVTFIRPVDGQSQEINL